MYPASIHLRRVHTAEACAPCTTEQRFEEIQHELCHRVTDNMYKLSGEAWQHKLALHSNFLCSTTATFFTQNIHQKGLGLVNTLFRGSRSTSFRVDTVTVRKKNDQDGLAMNRDLIEQ